MVGEVVGWMLLSVLTMAQIGYKGVQERVNLMSTLVLWCCQRLEVVHNAHRAQTLSLHQSSRVARRKREQTNENTAIDVSLTLDRFDSILRGYQKSKRAGLKVSYNRAVCVATYKLAWTRNVYLVDEHHCFKGCHDT